MAPEIHFTAFKNPLQRPRQGNVQARRLRIKETIS
jgi:hypothetical protein